MDAIKAAYYSTFFFDILLFMATKVFEASHCQNLNIGPQWVASSEAVVTESVFLCAK